MLSVRPARVDDVAEIFRIRLAVRENRLTRAQLAELGVTETAVAAMADAGDRIWCAFVDAKMVGFSIVDPDAACVFAMFVLPDFEGKGVGRRLLAPAEAALFQRHDVIWLETARNSRAAGFYRRMGWGDEADAGGGDIRLEKRRAQPKLGDEALIR